MRDQECKRIALQDHLTRLFSAQTERFSFQAKGSGKSGLISISRCGQEVLERSACEISRDTITERKKVFSQKIWIGKRCRRRYGWQKTRQSCAAR